MRAGLPKREGGWLKRWQDIGVYQKLRAKSVGRPVFTLHDGPPYANGHLHIGHAFNKILKDMVVRTHQMLGYDSRYIPGWDCHGLPIEWKVEEEYRSKNKDKNQVAINDFRAECRKFAEYWVEKQRDEFMRMGITGNWEQPYLTMDFHAERVISEEFMKLLMNGTLYQGSKPVMWSPVEKTALAEAEIEYHDHISPTVWVGFSLQNTPEKFKGAKIIIWTTTPWTLPSNKAIAFNPELSYGLFEVHEIEGECWAKVGDKYFIADSLANEVMKSARVQKFTRIMEVSSEDLENIIALHPFSALDNFWGYEVPVISAKYVTGDVGTGFVHTAPSHGVDDFESFAARGWLDKMTHNIGEASEFLSHVPFFAGLEVFNNKGKPGKANTAIIEKLIESNAIIARGRVTHSYPHSWRSKAPVIFRNTRQWFAAIDKDIDDDLDMFGKTIRARALAQIDNVGWTPKSGRNRLHAMICARPDWVLSRQRVWGVPLSCFTKKNTHPHADDFLLRDQRVNARISEAFEKKGADSWFEKNAKERFLEGLYNPNDYDQVFDILDVWFDSGSTHAFTLRDRDDGTEDGRADVYLEGTDQHRGWFHSSLLQSVATTGRAPYRNVITHGFTLDKKGMKMSKSVGNIVAPQDIIKQYGADILRLWVAQSDYSSDQRIGDEILKGVSDSYRRLRNALRYILGALVHFDPTKRVEYADMPELERWVLHHVATLDKTVREGYAQFNFQNVLQAIFNFATSDLSAFYFDIRKDALYCDNNSVRQHACLTVLDILFHRLVTWLAPILVFTAEEVWLERYGDDVVHSVHLQDFPDTPESWLDTDLAEKWALIRNAREAVTQALEHKRQDKIIGSSLEAAPAIHVDQKFKAILDNVDFADICIVSDVEIKVGNIPGAKNVIDTTSGGSGVIFGVVFASARGEKCARCWKILPDVGCYENEAVCARCDEAVRILA